MLLVAPVRDEHALPLSDAEQRSRWRTTPTCGSRVNVAALDDPGGHARRLQRPRADRRRGSATRGSTGCSRRFTRQTGCPVLVNTSFNVRGEPIVCTPRGRVSLLPGDRDGRAGARGCVLLKQDVVQTIDPRIRERYLAQFQLD